MGTVVSAFRSVLRSPKFAVAVILLFSVGIGANTAVLSLANQILVRPLPVRDPASLVLFHWGSKSGFPASAIGSWEEDPATHLTTCTSFSRDTFERFAARSEGLEAMFAFSSLPKATVVVDGDAEILPLSELVSGTFFQGLGVSPEIGRVLGPSDNSAGAAPVAVLSHAYWMRRFGGEPSVLGKTISINKAPATIVGVAPAAFSGTLQVGDSPDLFLPLALAPRILLEGGGQAGDPLKLWWLQIMGRLKPGASAAQAGAALEPAFLDSAGESLKAWSLPPPKDRAGWPQLIVGPGRQGLLEVRHSYRRETEILALLAAVLIAIACANVAGLLISRGAHRRREIGIRLAIGASRRQVMAQFLCECLLLALAGGILALPIALWIESLLVALQPPREGHALLLAAHLDGSVFALALGIAMLVGLVSGLVPAIRSTRVDPASAIQATAQNAGFRGLPGKALLAVQIALSVVLLVGAGLFSGTLRNLKNVDVGFDAGGLLLFHLDPGASKAGFAAGARMDEQVAERLKAAPGVLSSTFSRVSLLSGMGWNDRIQVAGRSAEAAHLDNVMVNAVGGDFFSTYGLPVIEGRGLERSDLGRKGFTAVINQAMAARWFGSENPVGQTLERVDYQGTRTPIEVVGVIRDSKYSSLREPAPPTLYLPYTYSQFLPSADATFALRTAGDPRLAIPTIREAIRGIDPLVPIDDVRTQESQIAELSANERLFAWVSEAFSVVAVALVAAGLYGLVSYGVTRRTQEIGIRMALGARPGTVAWMVLRDCLVVAGAGVLAGAAISLASSRTIQSLLYGLTPADPLVYLGTAAILIGTAAAAGWAPARRAARIEPMAAIRRD